jgi:PleD family two-component response regulator
MRTADETAASVCSEPQDYSPVHPGRQDGPVESIKARRYQDGRRGSPGEEYSVLILDASEEHAASLVDALQEAGIEATAFQDKHKFLEHVAREPVSLAVLVLHSKSWWKDELRTFCYSVRYLKETTEIICVLKWRSKGPQDRIDGEALGVGVLHA